MTTNNGWAAVNAWAGISAIEEEHMLEEAALEAAAERAAIESDAPPSGEPAYTISAAEIIKAATPTPATFEGNFTCGAAARDFILAGNARFTLVSNKTGARFTFRARAKDQVFFVALLTGQNNDADFQFLGTVFADRNYRHGRKSRIGENAPAAKAMAWAWSYLAKGQLPPGCQIWHEGKDPSGPFTAPQRLSGRLAGALRGPGLGPPTPAPSGPGRIGRTCPAGLRS